MQRPQKGTSLEGLSHRKATEATRQAEARPGGVVGLGKSQNSILQAKGSKSLNNFKLGPDGTDLYVKIILAARVRRDWHGQEWIEGPL